MRKSAAEAVACIKSGHRVFVHGGSATPLVLLDALIDQADRLQNVEPIHLHTECSGLHAAKSFEKSFRVVNLFVGANIRTALDYDRVDYLPCFLSEVPKLFTSSFRPIDVAMLHVSPPDKHGYCTLGTSVDIARAAFDSAQTVIAQINKRMPSVHGDGFIHINDIDAFVEIDMPLPEPPQKPSDSADIAIGKLVVGLVKDGACLQVGIGAVPNAILASLMHHRHLGIHSEMWSDGVLKLIESGAVDNARKAVHIGKTVSGFIIGSRKVYDFIHENPSVIQLGIDYVNNPNIIARNKNVVAINSAVEIDLTGQICADSIGHRIISGVGGQMDFMHGAALSVGGKPIIAMKSQTKTGQPRIVPALKKGAGVVSTRAHVHYVVTEYGIANLFGKTLGERAKALIEIAHPSDREWLSREWFAIRNL